MKRSLIFIEVFLFLLMSIGLTLHTTQIYTLPEPATIMLAGIGLIILAGLLRKKKENLI